MTISPESRQAPPITKKQFLCGFVASTVGLSLWLIPGELPWAVGTFLLWLSFFILMTRTEWERPVPRWEVVGIFAGLFLLIAVCVVSKRWIPVSWEAQVMRSIRHPLFVVPVWALSEFGLYRRWRLGSRISK